MTGVRLIKPVDPGPGFLPSYVVEARVVRGRSDTMPRWDTIPGIRVQFPPVFDGPRVIGLALTSAFSYDATTGSVQRSPVPEWFGDAATDLAIPAFSPGGRYLAYLARTPEGQLEGLVRSWPDGAVLARGPSAGQPPVREPGRMTWSDSTAFTLTYDAAFPQTVVRVVARGRVGDPAVAVDTVSWDAYFDSLNTARLAAVEDAKRAEEAQRLAWTALAKRLDRVVDSIPRLTAAWFPQLPAAFARELNSLGCTVPQSHFKGVPHNVIRGSFGGRGQEDWAALCSRGNTSVILVHWGGPLQCPRELLPLRDRGWMEGLDDDRFGFTRLISTVDHYTAYGAPDEEGEREMRSAQLEHDGIDQYHGKGSAVWFCRDGKWIELAGMD